MKLLPGTAASTILVALLRLSPQRAAADHITSKDRTAFMRGKWGVGLRLACDGKAWLDTYEPDALVYDILTVNPFDPITHPWATPDYVLINLSDAAHGDCYVAPVEALTAAGMTNAMPNVPAGGSQPRDLFGEILDAFEQAGIPIVAYMASQGPAMFKHGSGKAFDAGTEVFADEGILRSEKGIPTPKYEHYKITNGKFSPNMKKWFDYVMAEYGVTSLAGEPGKKLLLMAYAEKIVAPLARRYGSKIAGWWFDHCTPDRCDKSMVREVIHEATANPNAAISFNDGQKVPLIAKNEHEDFTAGHVNPVAGYCPDPYKHEPTEKKCYASSFANYPMLLSIEATPEGFLTEGGFETLGHMFIPMGEKWNSGSIVWDGGANEGDAAQAADWMQRAMIAGGSFTWNLPAQEWSCRAMHSAQCLTSSPINYKEHLKVILRQLEDNIRNNLSPIFAVTDNLTKDGLPVVKLADVPPDSNIPESTQISATDPNGDALYYAKLSGPGWLQLDQDGTVTNTALPVKGINYWLVEAADGRGDIAKAYLRLDVNNAPTFTTDIILAGDATEDQAYTFQLDAGAMADLDGDALTLMVLSGEEWLSFAGDSFWGTPANEDVGLNEFVLKVDDGNGGTAEATLRINVINTNDAPYFTSNEITLSATQDSAFVSSLSSYAADDDEDAVLTYSKVSGPEWLTINTANGDLSGTPTNDEVGLNEWSFQVCDEIAACAEATLKIDVENVNDAPEFPVSPLNRPITGNPEADVGVPFIGSSVAGTAVDIDGDNIVYSVSSSEADTAWLQCASDGTLSGTPTTVGLKTWTLSASDGTASANAFLTIEVKNTNRPENEVHVAEVNMILNPTFGGAALRGGGGASSSGGSTSGKKNGGPSVTTAVKVCLTDGSPVGKGFEVKGVYTSGCDRRTNTLTAVTKDDGVASFKSQKCKSAADASWTFAVEDVQMDGYVYNADANYESSSLLSAGGGAEEL